MGSNPPAQTKATLSQVPGSRKIPIRREKNSQMSYVKLQQAGERERERQGLLTSS